MLSTDGELASFVESMVTDDKRHQNPIADRAITQTIGFRQEIVATGNFDTCPECEAPKDRLIDKGKAALCGDCGSFISQFGKRTQLTIRK